jgi:SAM-dependent methyltransferase/uncharacterized protein YbaR (Trm112 family)
MSARLSRRVRNAWRWWHSPAHEGVPAGAIVLDVGCGHWPNMRANIIADRFLWDDTERSQPLVLDERPFVVCDALRLPFKDKSVDHVVCSHLAEHLEAPEQLFAELSRVGRSGYIECPARIHELLHGWDYHKWYVSRDADGLLLEEKPRPIHDPEIRAWFARHFESDPVFEAFVLDNLDRLGLVTRYRWTGSVRYRLVRRDTTAWSRVRARQPAQGASWADLRARLDALRTRRTREPLVKRGLSRMARWASDRIARERLSSIICCPACRGDLTPVDGGFLGCEACNARYPHYDDVFFLVGEAAPGDAHAG